MVFNKVGTKVIMNMREILTVMNSTLAVVKISPLKKYRPVRDLNPQTLQYQCSSQPTELRSQVGVGHYVGS